MWLLMPTTPSPPACGPGDRRRGAVEAPPRRRDHQGRDDALHACHHDRRRRLTRCGLGWWRSVIVTSAATATTGSSASCSSARSTTSSARPRQRGSTSSYRRSTSVTGINTGSVGRLESRVRGIPDLPSPRTPLRRTQLGHRSGRVAGPSTLAARRAGWRCRAGQPRPSALRPGRRPASLVAGAADSAGED